jgi:CheY-like chemotaxis protein
MSPRSLRILVVDDSHDTADSLALLLRLRGHQVCTAYDGPSALVTACASRPDVVFLDLCLPGLDGFAVAVWLRKQEALRNALLIAMTGSADAENHRRATEAGFDHFVLKPFDCASLDQLIAGARGVSARTSAAEPEA